MKTKKCYKCGKTKPLSAFGKATRYKDGLTYRCKECNNIYSKAYREAHRTECIERTRKHNKSPKGKVYRRKYRLKKKYGLTPDDHMLMYILQNGRCKICKQHIDYDKVQTDHDHVTGKVRGLLCQRCNHLLAALDAEGFFANAIEYLKETE